MVGTMDKMKKICLLAALIAAFCAGAVEVVNFGVPGLTVRGVSGGRLNRISAQKPDLAVIMLGREEMCNARKLRTIEEFRADYETMLAIFRRLRVPVLIINIPPYRSADAAMSGKISQANEVLAQLAAQHDIPLFDLHSSVASAGENAPAEYLRQRLFTAADSAYLARQIAAIIQEKFPAAQKIVCIGGEEVNGYRLRGAGSSEGESFPARLKMLLNGITAASTMPQAGIPLPGSFVSRAKWIWYPESFVGRRDVTKVFRKKFTLTGIPAGANFICSGDDRARVFINGHLVGSGDWKRGVSGDAVSLLRNGENVIAVEVHNVAVDGGMIFRMDMHFADGSSAEVVSDGSWKAFVPENGCTDIAFNESNGESAWIIGDAGAFPWVRVSGFDYRRFLAADEKELMARLKAAEERRFAVIYRRLAQEEKRNYQVVYRDGRGMISDGSRLFPAMIFHTSSFVLEDYRSKVYLHTMYNAGYRLFKLPLILEDIWKSDGSIDFELIRRRILSLLDVAPEGRIIIGIGMNAPQWYVEQNLPEAVGYAREGNAPEFRNKDQQRALRMSYASAKWRRDTADVLSRIITFLENSPFASRIFAYAPHCGVYNTEWHYFGMRNEMPDNGAAMTAEFRSFLRARYGNDSAALQRAWNDDSVTFDTAVVPGVAARTRRSYGALRVRSDAPEVMDYLLCHQKVVADTILYFDRAAKNACRNRALVGNYCGYIFEMNFPAEGWHLENLRILDSPYVDFQLSPYGYGEHRIMGAGGFSRAVSTSYRLRNKLLIYEDDTRTHLNTVSQGHFAANADESAALMMRGFGYSLTAGCGIWILDFNRGWFEDDLLRRMLRRMHEIRRNAPSGGSVAQVALVCDFDSVIYHTYSDNKNPLLNKSLLDGTILELGQCGVPFDTVFVQDIGKAGLPDYQVYIFSNMLKFTPERAAMVQKLKAEGKVLLWLYAPGIIDQDEISPASVAALTGFNVRMLDGRSDVTTVIQGGRLPGISAGHRVLPRRRYELSDVPQFVLDDRDAVILGKAVIGGVEYPTLGMKEHGNGFSLLHTVPRFDRILLMAVLQKAGVHRFVRDIQPGDVLHADRSFLVFHTASGGSREFVLPSAKKVTMLWPEEKVITEKSAVFTLELPGNHTVLLQIE